MSSRSDGQLMASIIKAPLSGPLVPLAEVPDPVFAQKLVGDGISIDPITSQLWRRGGPGYRLQRRQPYPSRAVDGIQVLCISASTPWP
jgi:hypothetical protein